MKIYVASSWRNEDQPALVRLLKIDGHEVYDFRNPPNRSGFAWGDLDPDWQSWNGEQYVKHLDDPDAIAGFNADMEGLVTADVCVLLLPCGRSAHLEAGYAAGAGKAVAIVLDADQPIEPELMYKMAGLITSDWGELVGWLDAGGGVASPYLPA